MLVVLLIYRNAKAGAIDSCNGADMGILYSKSMIPSV
jgi:hypothetical protein